MPIVTKVDLPGVDSVVADDAHDIEGLLNTPVETFLYKRSYISVDVVPFLAKVLAEFLNSKA